MVNCAHFLRRTVFLCALLSMPVSMTPVQTRGEAAFPQSQFAIETMICTFSGLSDAGKTYVEIYLTLLSDQFEYVQREDNNYYAFIQFDVAVKDAAENVVDSQSWKRVLTAGNASLTEGHAIVTMANFLLEPGNYNLSITVTDLTAKRTSTAPADILSVPRYPTSLLSMSDIEFASVIRRSQEKGDFVKHDLYYVEPYPAKLYSNARPQLYFYAEIYNLDKPENDEDTYSVTYQILNKSGAQVHMSTNTRKKPETGIALIAERVNILSLPNDVYLLYVSIKDNATGFSAQKKGTFLIYKPDDISVENRLENLNMDITPNNIKEFRNQIEYITTPTQQKAYQNLNFEEQKRFILNFWNSKQASFRNEHFKRYQFANEHYAALGLEGWRTDRGRVYIVYGEPTNMEMHPADPGMRPWELWTYEGLKGQGLVMFIFGDITGFGNYELLHSTYKADDRSEIYDPNWQERLIK